MTPFAQILASLRSVRNNYINLTNIPQTHRYVKTFHRHNAISPPDWLLQTDILQIPKILSGVWTAHTV